MPKSLVFLIEFLKKHQVYQLTVSVEHVPVLEYRTNFLKGRSFSILLSIGSKILGKKE